MSNNDVSALLGQKMLQGWTMLAEACTNDDCFVPLMERKKDATILCVKCNVYYKRENIPNQPGQFIMKQINDKATTQQTEANSSIPTTVEPTKKKDDQPTAPLHNQASEIKSTIKSTDNEQQNKEVEERMKKVNDVSAKMGQKLLQGWALLQESCPLCMVPLMRDRTGKMMCISCNTQVVTQADFDPSKYSLATNVDKSDTTTTTTPSIPSLSTSTPSSIPSDINKKQESPVTSVKEQDLDAKKRKSTKALGISIASNWGMDSDSDDVEVHHGRDDIIRNREKKLPNASHKADKRNESAVVEATLAALYNKLNECQKALNSPGLKVKESKKVCSLITECAASIAALRSL